MHTIPSRTRSRLGRRALALITATALLVPLMPVTPVAAEPAPVTVKLAVAAPLTQGATEYGQGLARGAELAVAQYNASESFQVNALTVQLVQKDDKGDPNVAYATVAPQIVADSGILGVVGHLNSGCSIPASQVYNGAHLAMVTPMSTNPVLTQMGRDNVFRTVTTDAEQGPAAADRAFKGLLLKRCFIVDDSTPYGEELSVGFAKRYKSLGGVFVGSAKTSDEQADFSTLVAKIKAAKPDVVYYGGIFISGGFLAKQLSAAGVTAPVLGGDGLFIDDYVTIAGAGYAEGDYATSIGLPVALLPGRTAFLNAWNARYPATPPTDYDAYAYDAASAILEAYVRVIDAAETNSALLSPGAREAVRAQVAATNMDGVTGHISFNVAGDTTNKAVTTYRVRKGKWEVLAWRGEPGRVSGRDRYLTSIEVSKRSFTATAPAVVLATGQNFPDALCAGPLAKAYGGPVLLVPPAGLTDTLRAELARLAPKDVLIVGSSSIVPTSVADAAAALGSAPTVKRLSGIDRFETAAVVAEEIAAKRGGVDKVVVATGYAFPDALSATPMAAANGWPILLTRWGKLPESAYGFVTEAAPSSSVIVGGVGAVSASVAASLPAPYRISGADRFETCRKIAEYGASNGLGYGYLAVATGANYPDALSAGPMVAANKGQLLLINAAGAPAPIAGLVVTKRWSVTKIDAIGGTGPLPDLALKRFLSLY